MFYNYAQFKKATKTLLDEMKVKSLKLSGLRLSLVQSMGFSTVEAYEASFNREVEKTITVITVAPQQNVSKKDFTANDEGQKKANDYFVKKILELEPNMDESEIECFLDDGYYSKKGSDFEFYIVHSDD